MSTSATLLKGHGTENDFVVLADLDATVSLSPELVRALCDRRAGIGADGLLRVVRTKFATEPDVSAQAAVAPYFMDFHNADGSIAEMCGNGVRVFARYLLEAGLIDGPSFIATRGGPRWVSFSGADVTVEMGTAVLRLEKPAVHVPGLDGPRVGIALEIPNPHVVIQLDSPDELERLDLTRPPSVQPALPDGQNVEFAVLLSERHLQMRVHERGVGETRSCGTGICAAVAALSNFTPDDQQRPWLVDVPGGRCEVGWTADGGLTLTGPAVLVAELTLSEDWLARHR